MTRPPRFLFACMLASAGVLILAGESQSQMWRFRPGIARRASYPPGWPNRMPGWDEKYIYPWSPYNIGRNPYNPGPYPLMYPDYPSSYAAYPGDVGPASFATNQEPVYGTEASPSQMLLPDPTGAMSVAPPTAALIRLRVPDAFAEVKFDGVDTESVGRTRYYVTPDLTSDKPFSYEITARWQRGDGWVTETRKIQVRRGQITTVDFTRKQTAGR